MKLNWNFQGVRGGGGEGGCKTKNLSWEKYGYFLELHILLYMGEEGVRVF